MKKKKLRKQMTILRTKLYQSYGLMDKVARLSPNVVIHRNLLGEPVDVSTATGTPVTSFSWLQPKSLNTEEMEKKDNE